MADLLDQAVQLFGPETTVHAELARYRPGDGGDDEAFITSTGDSSIGMRAPIAYELGA